MRVVTGRKFPGRDYYTLALNPFRGPHRPTHQPQSVARRSTNVGATRQVHGKHTAFAAPVLALGYLMPVKRLVLKVWHSKPTLTQPTNPLFRSPRPNSGGRSKLVRARAEKGWLLLLHPAKPAYHQKNDDRTLTRATQRETLLALPFPKKELGPATMSTESPFMPHEGERGFRPLPQRPLSTKLKECSFLDILRSILFCLLLLPSRERGSLSCADTPSFWTERSGGNP